MSFSKSTSSLPVDLPKKPVKKELSTPPADEVSWNIFERIGEESEGVQECTFKGAVMAKTWYYARKKGMSQYGLHYGNIVVKLPKENAQ